MRILSLAVALFVALSMLAVGDAEAKRARIKAPSAVTSAGAGLALSAGRAAARAARENQETAEDGGEGDQDETSASGDDAATSAILLAMLAFGGVGFAAVRYLRNSMVKSESEGAENWSRAAAAIEAVERRGPQTSPDSRKAQQVATARRQPAVRQASMKPGGQPAFGRRG